MQTKEIEKNELFLTNKELFLTNTVLPTIGIIVNVIVIHYWLGWNNFCTIIRILL